MNNIDIAKHWYSLGVATIPLQYRGKRPNFQAFKNTNDLDEHGRVSWKKYQDQLPAEEKLKIWFQSKFTNLAVITNYNGLTICDFDNLDIWSLWKSWITAKYPDMLKKTYLVQTRRGFHAYFFIKNPPERTLKIGNIDIKSAGGYCAAPISIHPTGHVYTSLGKPSDIMTVESLECVLPKSLLEKASKEVEIPCINGNGHRELDPWQVTPTIQGEDPIKWIKQNRSITEFFPHAQPSGGNRWFKVLCPFHQDNSESGWLDVQRNRFGCQAGCVGSGIDIIDFYALLKNVDRSAAVRELAR